MKTEKDYEELLKLLNKNKVKYCIVGAYAVAFYARPRYTKDIDILVEPTIENGKRLIDALNEFGFSSLNLSENDFCQKETIIQLGYEPVRVDIITSVQGCPFEKVWDNKVIGNYGDEEVFFMGLNELIECKQAANRMQDKADVEILLDVKDSKELKK
ncbi:MAG: hypothetical protein V1872_02445 [bacterium]